MPPAFADWLAICITSWVLFSFALYVASLGWCLFRTDWREVVDWRWFSELTGHVLAWCRKAFLPWRGSGSGESLIDAAVRKLVQQRKRNFMRRALLALTPIFALGDLFLVGRLIGLLPPDNVEHPSTTHLTGSAAFRVMTALCVLREDQPSKGIVVAFHIAAFGSLLLVLDSYSSGLHMLFDRTALGVRIILLLTLCDLRLTIFCNSMYCAFTVYKFHEFASGDESFAQLGLSNHLHQELGLIAGFVAFHLSSSWRLEADSRTTIDAKVSTKFIAGLRKLLKTRYDVVVELDDQMMLADDAKDLAGVLLHGPQRSLKGAFITDLMTRDADKDVFSSHVMNPTLDSEAHCCAIPHVFHMRDACSNVLCMEMWHTRFEDLDSRLRHLIAIKELAHDEQMWNSLGPTDMPLTKRHQNIASTAKRRRSILAVDVSDEDQPRQGQISRPPGTGEVVMGRRSSLAVDVSDEEQTRQGQISRQPQQGHLVTGRRSSSSADVSDKEHPRQGQISRPSGTGEEVMGRRSSLAVDISDEEQTRQGHISRQPQQGHLVTGRRSSSSLDVSDKEQPRQGQISRSLGQGEEVMGRRSSLAVDISDEEQTRQGQISGQPRQQPAPQEVGRPRDISIRVSDEEDFNGSSVSWTPSERSHRYLLEGFRLTSPQAQRASMMHTLLAWNVALRPAECCAYHTLIKEAANAAKWLANANCQKIDSIHSQAELWQCPTCGILSTSAASACYLCKDHHDATVNLIDM